MAGAFLSGILGFKGLGFQEVGAQVPWAHRNSQGGQGLGLRRPRPTVSASHDFRVRSAVQGRGKAILGAVRTSSSFSSPPGALSRFLSAQAEGGPHLSSGAAKQRGGLRSMMRMSLAAAPYFPCWWSEFPSGDGESPVAVPSDGRSRCPGKAGSCLWPMAPAS